jgi:hypothetical protein
LQPDGLALQHHLNRFNEAEARTSRMGKLIDDRVLFVLAASMRPRREPLGWGMRRATNKASYEYVLQMGVGAQHEDVVEFVVLS